MLSRWHHLSSLGHEPLELPALELRRASDRVTAPLDTSVKTNTKSGSFRASGSFATF